MVTSRINSLPGFVLLALLCACGCQTGAGGHGSALVSCGETAGCAGIPDPLIIFVGADRDLGKWGKLPEVTEDFRRIGYNAVYLDPWKQCGDVELLTSWIRHAARCQGRRILLVGWSQGAVVGLKALQNVAAEGIRIDTFVELDCFSIDRDLGRDAQPSNVNRVVVIHSRFNRLAKGYRAPVVHELETFWHLGSPTDPHTQRVLLAEARRLQSFALPQTAPDAFSNLSASAPVEDSEPAAATPRVAIQTADD